MEWVPLALVCFSVLKVFLKKFKIFFGIFNPFQCADIKNNF
jgi:hypothetical protein